MASSFPSLGLALLTLFPVAAPAQSPGLDPGNAIKQDPEASDRTAILPFLKQIDLLSGDSAARGVRIVRVHVSSSGVPLAGAVDSTGLVVAVHPLVARIPVPGVVQALHRDGDRCLADISFRLGSPEFVELCRAVLHGQTSEPVPPLQMLRPIAAECTILDANSGRVLSKVVTGSLRSAGDTLTLRFPMDPAGLALLEDASRGAAIEFHFTYLFPAREVSYTQGQELFSKECAAAVEQYLASRQLDRGAPLLQIERQEMTAGMKGRFDAYWTTSESDASTLMNAASIMEPLVESLFRSTELTPERLVALRSPAVMEALAQRLQPLVQHIAILETRYEDKADRRRKEDTVRKQSGWNVGGGISVGIPILSVSLNGGYETQKEQLRSILTDFERKEGVRFERSEDGSYYDLHDIDACYVDHGKINVAFGSRRTMLVPKGEAGGMLVPETPVRVNYTWDRVDADIRAQLRGLANASYEKERREFDETYGLHVRSLEDARGRVEQRLERIEQAIHRGLGDPSYEDGPTIRQLARELNGMESILNSHSSDVEKLRYAQRERPQMGRWGSGGREPVSTSKVLSWYDTATATMVQCRARLESWKEWVGNEVRNLRARFIDRSVAADDEGGITIHLPPGDYEFVLTGTIGYSGWNKTATPNGAGGKIKEGPDGSTRPCGQGVLVFPDGTHSYTGTVILTHPGGPLRVWIHDSRGGHRDNVGEYDLCIRPVVGGRVVPIPPQE